jgi:hypothetical protein
MFALHVTAIKRAEVGCFLSNALPLLGAQLIVVVEAGIADELRGARAAGAAICLPVAVNTANNWCGRKGFAAMLARPRQVRCGHVQPSTAIRERRDAMCKGSITR